ncbi:hypothetical protein FKP32DRAFT_604390 [Trametes sanguinea]|nr:hypothetical protein FKP32DRAFT_604390 [Trametes sanguinea]
MVKFSSLYACSLSERHIKHSPWRYDYPFYRRGHHAITATISTLTFGRTQVCLMTTTVCPCDILGEQQVKFLGYRSLPITVTPWPEDPPQSRHGYALETHVYTQSAVFQTCRPSSQFVGRGSPKEHFTGSGGKPEEPAFSSGPQPHFHHLSPGPD